MDVQMPDGRVIRGVPEGTTKAELTRRLAKMDGPRPDLKATNPAEYDPTSPEYQAKYGPAAVSAVENLAAGAGKAVMDMAQGAGQYLGLTDRQDVAATRERDAPLMATGAGKVGNVAGAIGAAVPALMIPGANTVVGAGLVGAGIGAVQPSESTRETLANTGIGAIGGAGGQYVGGKLGQYIGKRIAARQAARVAQAASPRSQSLVAGQQAGYVVPPASAKPTLTNRSLEGVSGKAATQQAAAVRNQQVTNALARAELGLANDSAITRQTLRATRAEAGKAYDAIAGVGRFTADSQYLDDLVRIGASVDDVAAEFPGVNVADDDAVRRLVDGLLKDDFSSKAAISLLKRLRFAASKNLSGMNAADPAKKALGTAQRDASAAVEELIERNLQASGMGDLATNFQNARVLIAKTYSIENALNPGTGNVVASNLGRQLKSGKPLSGNIETIANMAASFPKAMAEQLDSPGVSAVDALIGLVGGTTINPALLAVPAARMGTRSAILAGPYQRSLLTPGSDSLLSSLLLGSKLAPAAGVSVPAYVGQ